MCLCIGNVHSGNNYDSDHGGAINNNNNDDKLFEIYLKVIVEIFIYLFVI